MSEFYVERRKWPDRPHYRHRADVLGEDEHGLWVGVQEGTPISRDGEVLFPAKRNAVMCIAAGRCWMASFTDGGSFDLYCDVVTPISLGPAGALMVDLDLDVVRWEDGRVEVLDEDEFAEHRVLYGYPDDVCARAEEVAAELARSIVAGEPPFVGCAERWLEALAARTERA